MGWECPKWKTSEQQDALTFNCFELFRRPFIQDLENQSIEQHTQKGNSLTFQALCTPHQRECAEFGGLLWEQFHLIIERLVSLTPCLKITFVHLRTHCFLCSQRYVCYRALQVELSPQVSPHQQAICLLKFTPCLTFGCKSQVITCQIHFLCLKNGSPHKILGAVYKLSKAVTSALHILLVLNHLLLSKLLDWIVSAISLCKDTCLSVNYILNFSMKTKNPTQL